MKFEDYNSRAQEALGQSFMEISNDIFKKLILLVTIVPITAILKVAFDGDKDKTPIFLIFQKMSAPTYLVFLIFVSMTFWLALDIRKKGLWWLHASAEKSLTIPAPRFYASQSIAGIAPTTAHKYRYRRLQ